MTDTSLLDLTAVLTVARRRSFRAAALELGRSPTALSSAIAKPEASLGVRLFHRTEHEAARLALADSLPASLSASLPAAVQAKARALIEACQRCDADVRPLVDARLNELRVVLRAARAGSQADA